MGENRASITITIKVFWGFSDLLPLKIDKIADFGAFFRKFLLSSIFAQNDAFPSQNMLVTTQYDVTEYDQNILMNI